MCKDFFFSSFALTVCVCVYFFSTSSSYFLFFPFLFALFRADFVYIKIYIACRSRVCCVLLHRRLVYSKPDWRRGRGRLRLGLALGMVRGSRLEMVLVGLGNWTGHCHVAGIFFFFTLFG